MKCNSAFALLVCFVAVLAHPASAATSSVGAPPGAMPGAPSTAGMVTDEFVMQTAGSASLRIAEPPWLPQPGMSAPRWQYCALTEYHMGGRESSGQCRVYRDSIGWVLTGYVGRGMGGPVTCRAQCQYLR